ncbi:LysR family transcriptional regulator [Henriciella mobilis]|uniref:LysR family transcriptional regulator n=1 Tax=Henriciella mobilis TaxID=2305467 RepID=A0A399R9S8_9PROT|nr:LysR family transcriptional regulator [Henriciella mobilis]RIJ27201.1 LysR family transcriptional regulator [Henriciella mobilis]
MINVRHLRAFLALVEHKHFTKAAEAVLISQSALSALIQQMESDFSVKLFDRSTRSVEPTSIGLEFYDIVKKFLGEFDEALLTLSEYGRLKRGRVTIGALPSLAATILPDIVARFQEEYPDILVSIIDAPGEELADLLRARRIDLALSRTTSSKDIHSIPLFHDRLVLVGRLKHAKPIDLSIPWDQLADEPIIAMTSGTTIRSLIDAASAQAGIHLNIVLTPRLIPTALAFARSGLGCAILPSSEQFGSSFADLPQYELVNPNMRREISLMRLRSSELAPAARALATHMADGHI